MDTNSCTTSHQSARLLKFTDDTTPIGLISDGMSLPKAVFLNSGPHDSLPCMFSMFPSSTTPDSNDQLVINLYFRLNPNQVFPLIDTSILDLINLSLLTGYVPFRVAVIKPLLKNPTLDSEVLANYRPISNLPFLSKVLQSAS